MEVFTSLAMPPSPSCSGVCSWLRQNDLQFELILPSEVITGAVLLGLYQA